MLVRKQSYVCPFCETKKRWSAFLTAGKPRCVACGYEMYSVVTMPKDDDASTWKRLRTEFVRKRWVGGFASFHPIWLTTRKRRKNGRQKRWQRS